jgi:hypothetical protein
MPSSLRSPAHPAHQLLWSDAVSAFHPRTLPLCESLNYREWAGYYAVSAYEVHHEHECAAIRNGAALIDVSPLFKYRLSGPDATRLVDRIVTRDATKVAVGQVIYTPWCDERGMVIDDGTVSRLESRSGGGRLPIRTCGGSGRTRPGCGSRWRKSQNRSRRCRCRAHVRATDLGGRQGRSVWLEILPPDWHHSRHPG